MFPGAWPLAQDCLVRLRDWKPALFLGLAHGQAEEDVNQLLETQLVLAREVRRGHGEGKNVSRFEGCICSPRHRSPAGHNA